MTGRGWRRRARNTLVEQDAVRAGVSARPPPPAGGWPPTARADSRRRCAAEADAHQRFGDALVTSAFDSPTGLTSGSPTVVRSSTVVQRAVRILEHAWTRADTRAAREDSAWIHGAEEDAAAVGRSARARAARSCLATALSPHPRSRRAGGEVDAVTAFTVRPCAEDRPARERKVLGHRAPSSTTSPNARHRLCALERRGRAEDPAPASAGAVWRCAGTPRDARARRLQRRQRRPQRASAKDSAGEAAARRTCARSGGWPSIAVSAAVHE